MTMLSDEEKYKELASIIKACVKRDLMDKETKYIKWLSGKDMETFEVFRDILLAVSKGNRPLTLHEKWALDGIPNVIPPKEKK
jgi:hypothetical protein